MTKRDEKKRKNGKTAGTEISKEGWTEKKDGRNRDLRKRLKGGGEKRNRTNRGGFKLNRSYD